MNHHEELEQTALFMWAAHFPDLRWMFAIPNGGKRNQREAARLKAQGVKPGVSDVFLPLSRNGHQGLYIEMKRRKSDGPSRVTPKQQQFQNAMTREGYLCHVCFGAGEAIEVIKEYAKL
jgi:hypothetical protein